jgi:hypothetical protein
MARSAALPQLRAGRLRALAALSPLFVVEFLVATGNRTPQFLSGFALFLALAVLSGWIAFAVAAGLHGRVVSLNLGLGPRLDRRVVGDRVRTIRLLPLSVAGMVLPRAGRLGRDYRIINATVPLILSVSAALAALLLPGYAAAAIALVTALWFALQLTARDPDSGRTLGARIFVPPRPHTDPALARADRAICAHARVDVQFGDLDTAEAALARLRADTDADLASALLAVEILVARGDYDGALRVRMPEAAVGDAPRLIDARRATNSARAATLALLAAEQDASLVPKSAPFALRHLQAAAKSRVGSSVDRTGRALYALQAGDLRTAARENRICAARARMPLAIADALCTQARIEALRGKPAKAAKALDEAARFAPWYPRLLVVRQIVGEGACALAALPVSDAARDTSHVFAEPWSVPAGE